MKNSNINIIHVFSESVFIDFIIEQFSNLEINSSYFCLLTGNAFFEKIKYKNKIKFFENIKQLEEEIRGTDGIFVLHSRFLPFSVLNHMFKGKKIIWSSWGYDLYQDNRLNSVHNIINLELYKPYTLEYLKSGQSFKNRIRNNLSYLKNLISANIFYSRIKYVSCVLPNEFDLINSVKKNIENFIPIRYIEKNEVNSFTVSKKNNTILLNNSADPTGNHIDVLKFISKYINSETIIYIPFSYGVKQDYFERVKKEVKLLNLEKNVIFLTDFIEYEEYKKLLSSCSIAIFGHIRQQGIGNIINLLSSGVKVFFYEDSVSYQYYKKQGINVYTLEHDFNEKELKGEFDANSMNENIKLMAELQNYDNYLITLKMSLDSCFGQK